MSELRRTMRLPDATAMVVGIIIGASIFVQPSEITRLVPDAGGIALVWGLAGMLTLIGALICAELASAFPRTGGVYVWLRDVFGRPLGFLWGWAMFWSMHTGIIAAIAVVFARYVGYFVPLGTTGIRIVAVTAILGLSAFNCLGIRHGTRLQTIVTGAKLAAIALLIIGGLTIAPVAPVAESAAADFGASAVLLGLVAGLFAFGGWHMVSYTAEETVNPERTIPRSLVLGTLIVTVCYIALNAIYLRILSIDRVTASTRIAADAAEALVGPVGATLVAGLVILSTFGAVNGIILAGPRVYFSMANDGLFIRWAATLHPRFGTPARAIVLQGLWACALVMTDTYRGLFTRVVYTEWIFFGLLAVAVMLLRRRSDYAPPFRVPWAPTLSFVFVVSCIAIVVNQVRADPLNSIIGLAVVAAGLPVYYFWLAPRARHTRGAIAT
ncbi:MAG TPA: amino acid permease [Gemmatimonadaceae bacterium]|nr:amino acid permease [Gemmatimonadaceae bacterium]